VSRAHAQLVVLAEQQLELAVAGRWDELAAAMEDWGRAAASLPAVPPEEARGSLTRLVDVHGQLSGRLAAGRAETADELRALQRGRGAVRGYQAAALAPGGQIDGAA